MNLLSCATLTVCFILMSGAESERERYRSCTHSEPFIGGIDDVCVKLPVDEKPLSVTVRLGATLAIRRNGYSCMGYKWQPLNLPDIVEHMRLEDAGAALEDSKSLMVGGVTLERDLYEAVKVGQGDLKFSLIRSCPWRVTEADRSEVKVHTIRITVV